MSTSPTPPTESAESTEAAASISFTLPESAHRPRRIRSRNIAAVLVALPFMFFFAGLALLVSYWRSNFAGVYITIARTYFLCTILFPNALLINGLLAYVFWRRRRRRVLARAAIFLIACAAVVFAVRVYATHIEPYRLQVRRVTIASAKIRAPLRIVHITDIQTGGIGPYEVGVFNLINSLRPDLVIHTGDMMQPAAPATYASERPKMEALFRSLKPPLGILNVIGDCDYPMLPFFKKGFGGIRTLQNDRLELVSGGTRLRILGLSYDAAAGYETRGEVDPWLAKAAPDEFTILIGHRPDFILQIQDLPIDLCLAGHTHGGQIRIPGYGPIMTESQIPRAWASGYREVGKTRIDISGAVGSEHLHNMPAIRVNCPPELTVIDLVPK